MGEILFLAHRVPYPPDRGDRIRSFNILKKLREFGAVHVGAFADDEDDAEIAETLAPLLGSMQLELRPASKLVAACKALATGRPASLPLFASPSMQAYVDRILAERPIDLVFVFSGQMAQYVPALPAQVRFVMDFVDVDSAKFGAYGAGGRGPMGWMNRREARLLLRFERDVARRADCSLFVSEAEAALFRDMTGIGADKVRTLENGTNCTYFDPAVAVPVAERLLGGPLIVFTGQMDYRPNIEAVKSFVFESFPAIRAVHPDARFAIVGRAPVSEVSRLANVDGVMVTGSVPDIRGWLAAATVVVAPLRTARGVQNKVLEAMAMARPVIASKQAFEGIDAVPGQHLLVADGPEDEARLVLELLADPGRALTVGEAARRRMIERYSWASTLAPLEQLTGMSPVSTAAETR